MAVDREGLERVLRAFDQSDWDEIHLIAEGIELHLSVYANSEPAAGKEPYQPARHGAEHRGPTPLTDQEADPAGTEMSASAGAETDPSDVAAGSGAGTAGTLEVVAPIPGIFWRSPQPGALPYAEVGDRVEAGATLCIIEIMKLMSQVTAQQAGTVVEVLGRNGEPVELGQVLFRIGADGPG
jgi:acetyl-CoA carboxylase biotin carboxyl carrier protein